MIPPLAIALLGLGGLVLLAKTSSAKAPAPQLPPKTPVDVVTSPAQSPGIGTPPFSAPATIQTEKAQMDPLSVAMVAQAIASNDPNQLTQVAGLLVKQGFPATAQGLRDLAAQIVANQPQTPASSLPHTTTDPQLSPSLSAQADSALKNEGDPTKLHALARLVRAGGGPLIADQLDAKANAIQVSQDAAATIHQIDTQVIQPSTTSSSPGIGTPPFRPTTPTASFPPITLPTEVITAAPTSPLQVPNIPIPQPQPQIKSKVVLAAEALAQTLTSALSRFGTAGKIRVNEQALGIPARVRAFQQQAGLGSDGRYGPGVATKLASFVDDVVGPYWWPHTGADKALALFKTNLETLALDAEQRGNVGRAQALRNSAQRATIN